jgi:CO/xanthine dehydrogenase Mo-binding subunit
VEHFGAKRMSEAPEIRVIEAIANAIHDAIGVRMTSIPITPDKIKSVSEDRGKTPKK